MFGRIRWSAAAAVLAAAILALGLEGFFPHTDDGCRTEVHCIACRTLHVRPAVVVRPVVVAPAAQALEVAPVQVSRPLTWIARRAVPPRGPPPAV